MEKKRTCKHCQESFEIEEADLEFLQMVSPEVNGEKLLIPPPSLCPHCRWQRRLTFRNERTFYKRKCDLTGRSMISMHPEDSPFPVYYIEDWLGDGWEATDYGRDFDFSRPFFEQFRELVSEVPHFNLFIDPRRDVNSDYTNCSSESKNCYLISQAEGNQDCFFSRGVNHSSDCCDCLRVRKSELCYECINLENCYHCVYCQDCDNSSDCYFSSDLRGCRCCFGCSNLTQKEYYIYNEAVTKAEWQSFIEALVLTRDSIAEYIEKSHATRLCLPQRATRLIQCEEASGEHLTNCKDVRYCYDSNNLEHCAYVYEVPDAARYCQDYSMWGIEAELVYECCGCGHHIYQLLFSNHCWNNASYMTYCMSCFPSNKNCFGCFGLQHKEYCILNRQYSKEEYEKLLPRVVEHMRQTGEWGEFFPPEISDFGYNETIANEYFPLSAEEVRAKGWKWRDEESTMTKGSGKMPDNLPITEVKDEVLEHVYQCQQSGRQYKIIPQEYRFYKNMGLPLPTLCQQERHKRRIQLRNPRKLWKRFCEKCGQGIHSSYAPERQEIVFCEGCYLSTVE